MDAENLSGTGTIASIVPESSLATGIVSQFPMETGVLVRLAGTDTDLQCVVLTTSEGAGLQLREGDEVVVWVRAAPETGVILGRTGPPAGAEPQVEADELVLEARQALTLRVGDGSITIRDGRILIKGKDLVSHATRRNRIRGGSVEIN